MLEGAEGEFAGVAKPALAGALPGGPELNFLFLVACTSTLGETLREKAWGSSAHPGLPATDGALIAGRPTGPRARSVQAIYMCPAWGTSAVPQSISCFCFGDNVLPFPVAQGTGRTRRALSAGAGLAAFSVAGDEFAQAPPPRVSVPSFLPAAHSHLAASPVPRHQGVRGSQPLQCGGRPSSCGSAGVAGRCSMSSLKRLVL